MQQELEYRGVRTVISGEHDGARHWTIHPAGVAAASVSGVATADGTRRGSFKAAVFAARRAIDLWLETDGRP